MSLYKLKQKWFWLLPLTTLLMFTQGPVQAHDDDDDDNIVATIVSAPVLSSGTLADEPTEFNLIMNAGGEGKETALDPQLFGYQIPAGGRMEVELSDAFTRNTVVDAETGIAQPVAINPNANIILTTGPQNPIIFQSGATVARGNWSVSDDGQNTITVTPNGGFGDSGLENSRANEIGIKVIHVRPNPRNINGTPFINGRPGEKGTIKVRIYNAANEVIAKGKGKVKFRARNGRQIYISNEGLRTPGGGNPAAETNELIDFQRVAPNTALTNDTPHVPFSAGRPYAPRFLMFEALDPAVRGEFTAASYIPQAGIANVTYVINKKKPWKAKLVQITDAGTKTIGKIKIEGPDDDESSMILPSPGLTTIGGNGSFLTVPVKVGEEAGTYDVKVKLSGGGSAITHIIVE